MEIFDFRGLEPSTVEFLSTLEMKSGPGIKDEIFFFKDKGGRDLGLRFDLTVGTVRYVSPRKELKLPVKLASFADVWRYDEPQRGRYRWFYQWSVEIIGKANVENDAEVIEFTDTFLRRVGLTELEIELNDRRVVEEYFREKLGVSDENVIAELFRFIDKSAKRDEKLLVEEYVKVGMPRELLLKALELKRVSGDPNEVFNCLERSGLKTHGELIRLVDSLKSRDVKNIGVNLGIVRGLDYYSGPVYEVYRRERIGSLSLAGGGRYDLLLQAFGRQDLSGSGIAGGVERLLLALEEKREEKITGVYVAYVKEELFGKALNLVSSLRRNGIRSGMLLYGKSFREQLREAIVRKYAWLVIVAPDELSRGLLRVKNLVTKEELLADEREILEFFKKKGVCGTTK